MPASLRTLLGFVSSLRCMFASYISIIYCQVHGTKTHYCFRRTTHFMASSSTAEAADGTSHMEIYDQLRQVVETFPAAVSGIGQPYCRHPDGWYMSRRGVVSAMAIKRHLMARTTDVFIATFPKSGTTWLKALMYSALHHDAHELASLFWSPSCSSTTASPI